MSNYLIGKAELLTYPIKAPTRDNPGKAHPYTLSEVRGWLIPELREANENFSALTQHEAPNDVAVLKLTLHPAYIAKSYFPRALLGQTGLVAVGSKTVRIKPRKRSSARMPETVDTTQLLIAGRRSNLRALPAFAEQLREGTQEALDFAEIEEISPMTEADRIKPLTGGGRVFEVGLHLLPGQSSRNALGDFLVHARECGFVVNEHYLFEAGALVFVAVEGSEDNLSALARYSLARVVREMPKLRGVRPAMRGAAVAVPFYLPPAEVLSLEPKVAVLDGGLPENHVLHPFVRKYFESDPSAQNVPGYTEHGLGVTSALLFGPIAPGAKAEKPYALVDHHRVLDAESDQEDPYELYRTLGHVETVLLSRQYQFINLSLGPDLPFEDTDIHAWTAVIDNLLSDGETLLAVAAGNNGERDATAGLNRIQVPADGVNTLAVGAADSASSDWNRASYSAVGPGRVPGRRKPDLVAFGGSGNEYFHHAAPGAVPALAANLGTSFAAPLALRSAVGIRAALGSDIYPLTARALLLHACEFNENHDKDHVGWGRVTTNLQDLIACDDHSARIIYQGKLAPGKFLRAPLPLPEQALTGSVNVKATFCFASPTDPQDASAYTKAGLIVAFRPHEGKRKDGAKHPQTFSLFPSSEWRDEAELRADLGKWETVLHGEHTFRGSSLLRPIFDIHYNARDAGAPTSHAESIPYALIVTVSAPKFENIHQAILDAHEVLQVIEPKVRITIPGS
ncbi:MAG: S8 family peptidase [Xanthomonadaceae bacterium]|jgi:hypothetical protein|nr:S8 family peptidase [Xanthomonadaceae bacterium]